MSAVAMPPAATPPPANLSNEGRMKRKISKPERFNSPPPAKRFVHSFIVILSSRFPIFFSNSPFAFVWHLHLNEMGASVALSPPLAKQRTDASASLPLSLSHLNPSR